MPFQQAFVEVIYFPRALPFLVVVGLTHTLGAAPRTVGFGAPWGSTLLVVALAYSFS